MKILFICNSAQTDFVGGAVRYNRNLIQQLNMRGHEVTLVELGILVGRITKSIPAGFPRLIRFALTILIQLGITPWIGVWIAQRFWQYQSDVSIVESGTMGLGTIMLRLRRQKIITISHTHGWRVARIHLRRRRNWSKASLSYFIGQILFFANEVLDNRFSHRVIYLTEDARQLWAKWGIPVSKGSVIPYGVELDVFHPAISQSIGIPDQRICVLYVGHLQTIRNIPALIRAVQIIRARGLSICLQLAGGGELERRIRADVKQNHWDDWVLMLGVIRDDGKLAETMRAASMVVLPHAPGTVFIQALACGIPIVAAPNLHGFSGVVPPELWECATVSERDDAESLSAGILQTLNDSTTVDRVNLGLFRVSQYSWESVASKLVSVLEDVSRG